MAAAPARHRAYALGPGDRIGDYVVAQPLAMGGMAELYVAHPHDQPSRDRYVVIKRALPHLAQDPEFAAMFLKEARLASSLHHPNITRVLGAHEDEGLFYMVLEYVHGYDLRALIKAAAKGGGALPLPVALWIATELCAGLHSAHEHRDASGRALELVHRDVTPSNVLLDLQGRVLLTDFGIARALTTMRTTRAGVIKGKLGYMSPEQCRDGHLDRRSDLFSVGVLLYEMTTGYRMFNAANDFAVMNKIAKGDYARPTEVLADYPTALEAIVRRCTAVNAADRYPSAVALGVALAELVEAQGIEISATDFAAHLTAAMGDKPLPALPERAPGPDVTPTFAPAVPSGRAPVRRAVGMAAAAVLGVVAGGAVVLASTGGFASADAPTGAAPAQPSSPGVSPPSAAPRPEASDGAPPAPGAAVPPLHAPEVASVDEASPPRAEPAAADAPANGDAPRTDRAASARPPSTPRRRHGSKRKVPRRRTSAAGSTILPPSKRGGGSD